MFCLFTCFLNYIYVFKPVAMALNEVLFLPEPVVVSSRMMNRMWQAANKSHKLNLEFLFIGVGVMLEAFWFFFFNLNTFSFRMFSGFQKRQSSLFQVENKASTEGFNCCYHRSSLFISTPFQNIKKAASWVYWWILNSQLQLYPKSVQQSLN